jgi:branched-chain amino acid transport system ATP-binding protein
VLVEQNVQRAIALTDRYYLIERGQVTAQGRSDDRAERDALLRRLGV